MDQQQLYTRIEEQKEQLLNSLTDYWKAYSGMDTWYFWVNLACVILPLIILLFTIDKKRIFEISFFGYSVHILWANIDSILSLNNYMVHPHTISFLFPVGITMTAVVLPVAFMLMYQYCSNNSKNFYIYMVILSLIFAFVVAPISNMLDLLNLHNGMNYFYLFLIDIVITFASYMLTKFFSHLQRRASE
ncbi:hypothetical protein [Metabacillus malikii]|uniref:Uncharacterized protein n=1 Tax=Metabacillus malikii TaxID=1504265 RepID=A0ABT9ZKM2_9BACI|nr:hypothetical protein [Metabacillus malikii]MDQ0232327.1 hypothetical protein [Metabacillus malikii]